MVDILLLMYIIGTLCVILFLFTKKYLNSRTNTVSTNEKIAYGFNCVSFMYSIVCVFMVSIMEFLILPTPLDLWPAAIEFFNESLSYFSLPSLIMQVFFSVILLFSGFRHDPRESYAISNTVSYRRYSILIILYAIVGYGGVITGILI
jgi:hypothetical protein